MYCECTGIIILAVFIGPFICYYIYLRCIYDIIHNIKKAKVTPITTATETDLQVNTCAHIIEIRVVEPLVVY